MVAPPHTLTVDGHEVRVFWMKPGDDQEDGREDVVRDDGDVPLDAARVHKHLHGDVRRG